MSEECVCGHFQGQHFQGIGSCFYGSVGMCGCEMFEGRGA